MMEEEHGNAVHLPLHLVEDGFVPIYLQIVHQVRHLITSRGIAADDRLPSVRELAHQLGVNAGTVALSYRTLQLEGLIESRRGRGTFVAHAADDSVHFDHRQRALGEAIDTLLDRADALGFEVSAVKQYLVTRAQRPRRMPLVVLMPNLRSAEKYAKLIAAELPTGAHAVPHLGTLDQLAAGDAGLLEAYQTAYFTFTFVSNAPTVAGRLIELGISSEVVGITAQLLPDTITRLAALDRAGNYSLVAEAQGVNVALNLLAQFTPLDLRQLPVFTELSAPADILAAKSDRYIHTFSAGPQLDAVGIPQGKRLPLAFSLSDEARHRLRHLLDVTGQASRASNVPDVFLDA